MSNNRFPVVGSGRLKEGGRLVTEKQDFNAHWQGNGFRHMADNIDVAGIPNFAEGDLQNVLTQLGAAITSKGSGFVSVGQTDGYALGDYNVGSVETPTLAQAFAAAFTDSRLQNGGIILVLSGTYSTNTTIVVPVGITIMGESSGSIIIGHMTEQPIFLVNYSLGAPDIGGDTGGGPIRVSTGSNLDSNGFAHLILADNLDGYANLNPSMATVPMIQCRISSNVTIDHVTFLGRLAPGAVVGRSKTFAGIAYTVGGGTGTSLTVQNCFFDGVKTGINFTANQGNVDFLTVRNCRARTYGTENVSLPAADLNCFIATTVCNLMINENYHVGGGSQVNTMIAITSGGSITGIAMNVSGNLGGPNGNFGDLIKNLSGVTFKMNCNSNAWGQNIDNPWYLIVGGSNNGSPGGDIFGSGAIDIVLNMSLSNSFTGTVIVNPGTYTVTGNVLSSNNFTNLKFIGNKDGKNYPVFNLNLTATTTDALGNRPLVLGNHIESIIFNSLNNRHSIRPSFNSTSSTVQTVGGAIDVVDCTFINTSLYPLDFSTGPKDVLDNINTSIINLKNCFWLQNGTFADTISLVLPIADTTRIDNCRVSGNGYALSSGTIGFTGVQGWGNLFINDTIFDLTDGTITTTSLINSYISIFGFYVTLDNCQITCDNTLNNGSTPISATLLNNNTFNKFVYIKSGEIYLSNCLLVGSPQTFKVSGVDFALPTLYIEPERTAKVAGCKFFTGYLSIQVAGTGALPGPLTRDSITIDNCQLNSFGQTLLDIDLSLNSGTADIPYVAPYVCVSNCNFSGGPVAWPARHTGVTGAAYDSGGIVQIYAGECNVSFHDNNVVGTLSDSGTFDNIAAVAINNYNSPGANDGDLAVVVSVNQNFILATNNYTAPATNKAAAGLLVKSPVVQVCNNHLSLANQASISTGFIGCLVVNNAPVVTNDYSAGVVSNNVFARRDVSGGGLSGTTLARGYIQITSNSGPNGLIVDNAFDFTTFDGYTIALVEDNTALSNRWLVERNKNQSQSLVALYTAGTKSVASNVLSGNVVLAGAGIFDSTVLAQTINVNKLSFNYASGDSTASIEFIWAIQLIEILPPGVKILSITYSYQATQVPVTSKSLVATISSINGSNSDSNTITNTSVNNRSITLTNAYNTYAASNTIFTLKGTINHSSAMVVAITNLIFTYKW